MLKDKDRIFQNIYGFKGSGLDTAKSIGDWKNTKKYILNFTIIKNQQQNILK